MSILSQSAQPGLPATASLGQVIDYINRVLVTGHLNCVSLTVTQAGTTTTLTDPRIGPNSLIIAEPVTDHALLVTQDLRYTNKTKGSCTVNHIAVNFADLNVRFLIIGS